MASAYSDRAWGELERRLLEFCLERDTARLTAMGGPRWSEMLRLERRINRGWRLLAALQLREGTPGGPPSSDAPLPEIVDYCKELTRRLDARPGAVHASAK